MFLVPSILCFLKYHSADWKRMKLVMLLKTNQNMQGESSFLEMLKYQMWYPALWNMQRDLERLLCKSYACYHCCDINLVEIFFPWNFYFWVYLLSGKISSFHLNKWTSVFRERLGSVKSSWRQGKQNFCLGLLGSVFQFKPVSIFACA